MDIRERFATTQFYRRMAGAIRHPHSDDFKALFPGFYTRHDCNLIGCRPCDPYRHNADIEMVIRHLYAGTAPGTLGINPTIFEHIDTPRSGPRIEDSWTIQSRTTIALGNLRGSWPIPPRFRPMNVTPREQADPGTQQTQNQPTEANSLRGLNLTNERDPF